MTEFPSTSVALVHLSAHLVPQGRRGSIDELNDDDFVAIGRTIEGRSPRRVLRVTGMLGAIALSPLVALVSMPAAFGLIITAVILGALQGSKDAEQDLIDAGFSPLLAKKIGTAAAALGDRPRPRDLRRRISMRFILPKSDLLKQGRRLVRRLAEGMIAVPE